MDGMNADCAGDLIENQSLGKTVMEEVSDAGQPVGWPTPLDAVPATRSLRQQLEDKPLHGQWRGNVHAPEFPVQTGREPDHVSRLEVGRVIEEEYVLRSSLQRGLTNLNMKAPPACPRPVIRMGTSCGMINQRRRAC
jgi:hypothetical protein